MKKQNRNVVRLTESKLNQIVAESVKKVLNEDYSSDDFYSNSYWGRYADNDSGEYHPFINGAYDMQRSVSHLISLIDADIVHFDDEAYNRHYKQLNQASVGLYSHCKAFCEWMEKNMGESIEKYR